MTAPARAPVAEFARFLRTETVGGFFLLAAAGVALVWANTPLRAGYEALREVTVGPSALHLNLTLQQWATDGLLAVFFFVAGLELKRELVIGELAGARRAVLPVAAAVGGMAVPVLVALLVGGDLPGMEAAWSIPAATDIAFALAVLAVAGAGLPSSARVFLLSLAVVDDLGAVLLIAVLFAGNLHVLALLAAALLCGVYWVLQRKRVTSPLVYVPIAVGTWVAVHEAGIHATVAGVALALLTRVRPDPGEQEGPALRLEHRLQPWSAALCAPLFAFVAAGVPLGLPALQTMITDRVALAVIAGLLVGKVVGIFGAASLVVWLTPAVRPRGLGWRDLAAVSMLGGVGFTVSLLITELSLASVGPRAVESAKAAVLLSSIAAAVLAAALLVRRSRIHGRSRAVAPDDDSGVETTPSES
ncbi:MAG TPA: Na+/H+ antiporter NhaA [Actinophytocola sp.]|uniref:Na+/H+ antiporter NhaA n=1 Tax=Actinophytocola sp. TaxID=1872138 RepID=UPI002DB82D89|nr:Na+/H+ antiporter NhaA [Actinophytocola sp.]HEU5474904.1 Na+/H+ antiporter NhaA [Actinophytocola sp.]